MNDVPETIDTDFQQHVLKELKTIKKFCSCILFFVILPLLLSFGVLLAALLGHGTFIRH